MAAPARGAKGEAARPGPRVARPWTGARPGNFARPWLFILPGLVALAGIIAVPLFMAARYSLYEIFLYRFNQPWFVGFDNYRLLFEDPLFLRSLGTTITFTIGNLILCVVLGLLVAFLLSGKTVRFRTGFVALFLIPFVTTQVVVGLAFRLFIWEPEFGVVNVALAAVGLPTADWLIDSDYALWAAIATNAWHLTPLAILVFYAALATIPDELLEAARIDGASALQVLWHVIVPMIRSHTLFVSLIIMTSAFREFETIFTLTGGGPGRTTTTLSILAYNRGVASQDMGMANAIAFTMFAIMATLAWAYITLARSRQREQAA